MCRLLPLLILILASIRPALARPGVVQVRYTIDASQAVKRLLKVQAHIEGLMEGRTIIGFPDSRSSIPNRISQISSVSEAGESSPLTLEDGQFVVNSSGTEPLELVFQLRSESFQYLDRATYLDEARCVLHPQDVLLQIEGQDPKTSLTFLLPDQWGVASSVRPAEDGTFPIEIRRPAPFYLGNAETESDVDGLLWIAIEPGWPPPQELLASLRQQVRHRQKFSRGLSSKPFLAVFMSPSRQVQSKELIAFGAPQFLAMSRSPGLSETSLPSKTLGQAMARGLVRMQLPVIADFSVALGPERFLDYLSLKASLKTGILTKAEFLDAVASELWSVFGEPRELPQKSRSRAKVLPNPLSLPARPNCSGFLLDLALSFYGETVQSLDAFLARGFVGTADEPISEADLRKRLRQERQADAALAGAWRTESPRNAGEMLRPFGLLFERRELPAFDFQLNESFQIAQFSKKVYANDVLENGDRILAINNHRLMLPDDLLKCRSRLTPGQEIQLDVERRSLPLRVTQRVAKEVVLKLEVNKLADADKQLKLEQFLSLEPE